MNAVSKQIENKKVLVKLSRTVRQLITGCLCWSGRYFGVAARSQSRNCPGQFDQRKRVFVLSGTVRDRLPESAYFRWSNCPGQFGDRFSAGQGDGSPPPL